MSNHDDHLSAAWSRAHARARDTDVSHVMAQIRSEDPQTRLVALITLRLVLGRNPSYAAQVTDLACSILQDELDEDCIWQAAILLEMCARQRPEIVCTLAAELCQREHKEARVALGTTVLEYLVNLPDNLYRARLRNLAQTRPGLSEALGYCWYVG